MGSLYHLSHHLLVRIFEFVNLEDFLLSVVLVCKRFSDLKQDINLLLSLCFKEWKRKKLVGWPKPSPYLVGLDSPTPASTSSSTSSSSSSSFRQSLISGEAFPKYRPNVFPFPTTYHSPLRISHALNNNNNNNGLNNSTNNSTRTNSSNFSNSPSLKELLEIYNKQYSPRPSHEILLPTGCSPIWLAKCLLGSPQAAIEPMKYTGLGLIQYNWGFKLGELKNGILQGKGIQIIFDKDNKKTQIKKKQKTTQKKKKKETTKTTTTTTTTTQQQQEEEDENNTTEEEEEEANHIACTKFLGDWISDSLTGHGFIMWESGNLYQGECQKTKPHGSGRKTWMTVGDYYEGDWEYGLMHGQGLYSWASGACYKGTWENDLMQGDGIKTWKNGTRYIGSWKKDKMNGIGLKQFGNGDIQKAVWKEGFEDGFGDFKSFFNSRYYGNYVKGLPQGTGCFTHPEGYSWTGSWYAGLPEDEIAVLHPDIQICLKNGHCTRTKTGNTPYYAQILYQCNVCDEKEVEGKTRLLCKTCRRICHGHSLTSKVKIFTFGHKTCQCACC